MTPRYLAVVLLLAAIGAGLLGMRQQQLNDKHAIAEHHGQMKSDREQIKDLQVRIARKTTPEALQQAIDQAQLQLEPITREPVLPVIPAEPAAHAEHTEHAQTQDQEGQRDG